MQVLEKEQVTSEVRGSDSVPPRTAPLVVPTLLPQIQHMARKALPKTHAWFGGAAGRGLHSGQKAGFSGVGARSGAATAGTDWAPLVIKRSGSKDHEEEVLVVYRFYCPKVRAGLYGSCV